MRVALVQEQRFAALRRHFQPGRISLHGVVQSGEGPNRPALQPDRLVGIDQVAATVEGGEEPPLFAIDAVLQPERNHTLEQSIAIHATEFVQTGICQAHSPSTFGLENFAGEPSASSNFALNCGSICEIEE